LPKYSYDTLGEPPATKIYLKDGHYKSCMQLFSEQIIHHIHVNSGSYLPSRSLAAMATPSVQ